MERSYVAALFLDMTGKVMTDEDYAAVLEELKGRVDNFVDSILPDICLDIAHEHGR